MAEQYAPPHQPYAAAVAAAAVAAAAAEDSQALLAHMHAMQQYPHQNGNTIPEHPPAQARLIETIEEADTASRWFIAILLLMSAFAIAAFICGIIALVKLKGAPAQISAAITQSGIAIAEAIHANVTASTTTLVGELNFVLNGLQAQIDALQAQLASLQATTTPPPM